MNIPFKTSVEIDTLKLKYKRFMYRGMIISSIGISIIFYIITYNSPTPSINEFIFFLCGLLITCVGFLFVIFSLTEREEMTKEATLEEINEIQTLTLIHPEIEEFRLKLIEQQRKLTTNDYKEIISAIEESKTNDFYKPPKNINNIIEIEKISNIQLKPFNIKETIDEKHH